MRAGKVVAIKGDQVTVHEDGTRTQWKLSYAGIDPGENDERVESDVHPADEPNLHKPGRDDFNRGDKVSFTDKYLQPLLEPSRASISARHRSIATVVPVGACRSR